MNIIKAAAIICSLLLSFTGTASASLYPLGNCSTPSPSCSNQQDYKESFYTDDDDFKYDTIWNKHYGSFDAIDVPTLNIESVVLTVNSSSDGLFDSFYLESSYGLYEKIGGLDGGTQSFTLSSSWYDEVVSGLSFKAWFHSKDDQFLNWATLDVQGKYCAPPSAVPVPAAIWLFGPALLGFTAMRRRAKKA